VKKDFLSGVIALADEQPARAGRLIKITWPEIKAAMDQGHTLKVIHQRLLKGGVRISYRQFTAYVRQFLGKTPTRPRDRPQQPRNAKSTAPPKRPRKRTVATEDVPTHLERINREALAADARADDPWANLRDRLHPNRPGFQWDDEETSTDRTMVS
jgi:hypothetical protein